MGMSFRTLSTAAALALGLGGAASAATLTIEGGTAGSIPGATATSNNVLDNVFGIASLDGFFGSSIEIDEDATVRVEYIGFEAGATNTFTIDGSSFTTSGKSAFAADASSNLGEFNASADAGLLDFVFSSTVGGGRSIANGDANDNINFNFFATFGDSVTTAGNSLLLFLDDGGKSSTGSVDDNHDDLAIRISVVPLPAGMLLLLTGMGGLAAASRRRKSA